MNREERSRGKANAQRAWEFGTLSDIWLEWLDLRFEMTDGI